MTREDGPRRGEVLVAIINSKRDFAIVQDEHWYRIPVDTAPRRWPPRWLAFYQTKVFGHERWAVNYYGRVRDIRIRREQELGLYEPPHPKSERRYYQVHLHSLEQLERPILSRRGRRIVFIPTTWEKFSRAAEVNDLYDESPLEDRIWAELKDLDIRAERQWEVVEERYFLDFAVFCVHGKIAIEADGVSYHAEPVRWAEDRRRDRKLQLSGWEVLRFTGQEIRESLARYCIPEITQMIDRLGGQEGEGLVPRTFHSGPDGIVQQLSMFEPGAEYDAEEEW